MDRQLRRDVVGLVNARDGWRARHCTHRNDAEWVAKVDAVFWKTTKGWDASPEARRLVDNFLPNFSLPHGYITLTREIYDAHNRLEQIRAAMPSLSQTPNDQILSPPDSPRLRSQSQDVPDVDPISNTSPQPEPLVHSSMPVTPPETRHLPGPSKTFSKSPPMAQLPPPKRKRQDAEEEEEVEQIEPGKQNGRKSRKRARKTEKDDETDDQNRQAKQCKMMSRKRSRRTAAGNLSRENGDIRRDLARSSRVTRSSKSKDYVFQQLDEKNKSLSCPD